MNKHEAFCRLLAISDELCRLGDSKTSKKLTKMAQSFYEHDDEVFEKEEKAKMGIKLSELVYDAARSLGNMAGFEVGDELVAETNWDRSSIMHLKSAAHNIIDAVNLLRPDL